MKTQLNEGISRLIFLSRGYNDDFMDYLLEANKPAERRVRECAAEILNLIFDTLEMDSEPGPFESETEAQP